MPDTSRSQKWYHTTSGLMKAAGGLIGSIAAFLGVLHQIGVFDEKDVPPPHPEVIPLQAYLASLQEQFNLLLLNTDLPPIEKESKLKDLQSAVSGARIAGNLICGIDTTMQAVEESLNRIHRAEVQNNKEELKKVTDWQKQELGQLYVTVFRLKQMVSDHPDFPYLEDVLRLAESFRETFRLPSASTLVMEPFLYAQYSKRRDQITTIRELTKQLDRAVDC